MHFPWDPYNSSVLRLIDSDGAPGRAFDVDDDTIESVYLTDYPKQQSRSYVADLH